MGDSAIGERFPAWTRGNAADVFPEPFSPLGQTTVLHEGMCTGLRDAYIDIGVLDYDEFEEPRRPDLFKMFGGYLYNPLTLTRILGARMPGVTPELIDAAFFDERDEVPAYQAQDWHVSDKHEALLGEKMGWAMSTQELPALLADRELVATCRQSRPDLSAATESALIARARAMIPFVQQTFENAMIVSSLSSLGPGALGAICEAVGRPEDAITLLAGIEVDSAAPSHAMWELGRLANSSDAVSAAFEAGPGGVLDQLTASDAPEAAEFVTQFEQFLFDHGSRGQNEYDPRAASWEARPDIALAAIDLMRRSADDHAPNVRAAQAAERRDHAAAEIREMVAGDPEAAGTFEAALGSAQMFLAGRERAKTNVVRVINEMGMAFRELGQRYVDKGMVDDVEQFFMLTNDELDLLPEQADELKPVIAERWAAYQGLFDLEPVFVVNGTPPALNDMVRRDAKQVAVAAVGDVLAGAAGSGGSATGRARVILDAANPTALEPGDILIAPQTDPSWVPLFVPAAAVVVNVGAMGSHAMIVSRELGIPCVASVADATSVIPDGAMITVDGTTGTVTIDSL